MKKVYNTICLLIIALFCIRATMLNLSSSLFIGGDVSVRTAFPMQTLKQSVCMWDSNTGPGLDNTYTTTYIILSLFLIFLNIAGFSQIMFTKIFFFALLFMAGMSAYFLILYVLDNKTKIAFRVHFCAVIGALFYTFNYFSRTLLNNPSGHQPLVYSFFPLWMLLFIKGLEKKDRSLYYAIIFAFISIFILTCNLAHIGAGVIILALYFVYYILTNKTFWIPFRFAALSGIFSILLGSFIIFPMLSSLGLQENLQRNVDLGWFSMGSWLYSNSYFFDLFRTDGAVTYPPNFPIHEPVFVFFSYLLPIIVFSSLFWIRKNKNVLFFALISLLGIFLAKGCQKPFGEIFYYMGKIFPPFTIFKYSYDKFSMLITLGYGVMIGFVLLQYFRYWFRWLAIIAIIPVFICISWPFFIGGLSTGGFLRDIPPDYNETIGWMNDKPGDFKVLSLPPTDGNYVFYNWYFGQDLFITLLNKPIIESARVLNDTLRKLIKNGFNYELCRLLRILNVRYVISHEDISGKFYDISPENIKDILLNEKLFMLNKTAGKLNIYEIAHKFYLPHIYASNTPILVVSNENDAIHKISYSGCLKNNSAIFFSKDIRKLKWVFRQGLNMKNVIYFICENIDKWMDDIQRIKSADSDLFEDTKSVYVLKENKEFEVEKDGIYNIRAVASVGSYLARQKRIEQFIDFKDVNNIEINTCNVSYDCLREENGKMSISAYFDGNSNEDEFVQMRFRDFKRVDLGEYPFFYLRYKVEDSDVQTIEVIIAVDLNDDGIEDDTLIGLYQRPAPEKMGNYIVNVYDILKEKYPENKSYGAVRLEIYPHKIWWTDCTDEEKKRQYKFWLNEAGFYGYPEAKGFYITNRTLDLVDEYNSWIFNYNTEGYKLVGEKDGVGVFKINPFIEIKKKIEDIDIKKYPLVDFIYEILDQDKIESIELVFKFKSGDCIVLDNLQKNSGSNIYKADIRDIIEDRFQGKGKFLITDVILRIKLNRKPNNSGDVIIIKRMRLHNKKFIQAGEFICRKSIFKLDKDTYRFIKKHKLKEGFSNVLFKKGVFLKKGKHYFRNLIGGNLDFIIIEPADTGIVKQPIVKFKKINSTMYKIKLLTNSPCWLIFSESFNPKWKAYIVKTQIQNPKSETMTWSALLQMWRDRGKRVELKEHYKVNGYANAWFVEKNKNSEEVKIIIEYIPQRFFELGCIVSGLSLCMGCMILSWMMITKRCI